MRKLHVALPILLLIATIFIPLGLARQSGPTSNPSTGYLGKVVRPGETSGNADGVTVNNGDNEGSQVNPASSEGLALLTPYTGGPKEETSVVAFAKFAGTVEGLDSNDRLHVRSDACVSISAEAGAIIRVHGKGNKLDIENTSPPSEDPNAKPGEPFLEVELGTGEGAVRISIPAGSTVTISN